MIKKFLVVVDTQYDFMMPSGALYVQTAEDTILPGIDFLSKLNPDEYEGVLFTFDTHDPRTWNDMPESKDFPIHCIKGTPGWVNVFNEKLVPKAIPMFHLEKGVFNMWEEERLPLHRFDYSTSLVRPVIDFLYRDDFFAQMAQRDEVAIQVMGVASDYCVKWAVDGFVKRGFKVEVIEELCRGIGAPASDVFEGPDYIDVAMV